MKKIITILLCLISLIGYTQVYTTNTSFEDGDRTNGGALAYPGAPGGTCCTPDCMQITSEVGGRLGNFAIHAIVRATDALCGSSYRCEGLKAKDTSVAIKYWAFSVRPKNWYVPNVDSVNFLVSQFYTPYGIPMAIWVKRLNGVSAYYLTQQVDTVSLLDGRDDWTRSTYLKTVVDNEWTDFALEINWQSNHTGYVTVYVDGDSLLTNYGATLDKQHGILTYYPHARIGLYKFGGWTSTIRSKEAHFDVVRSGGATGNNISFFLLPKIVIPIPQTKGRFLLRLKQ
jgi:hypothetical protein